MLKKQTVKQGERRKKRKVVEAKGGDEMKEQPQPVFRGKGGRGGGGEGASNPPEAAPEPPCRLQPRAAKQGMDK